MKKYELTDEITIGDGRTLYRIRALRDFSDVKKGDLGGYIEKEENLSHDGDAWVLDRAFIGQNAKIFDSVSIGGNARICCDSDILWGERIGGESVTIAFRCDDGEIRIDSCGLNGTIEEFRNKVAARHGRNKYAREYEAFINLVKIHFDIGVW